MAFYRGPQSTELTIGFKFVHDQFSLRCKLSKHIKLKGLILAQNERWRRGLGMQVVRESPSGEDSGERESNGWLHTLRLGIVSGN